MLHTCTRYIQSQNWILTYSWTLIKSGNLPFDEIHKLLTQCPPSQAVHAYFYCLGADMNASHYSNLVNQLGRKASSNAIQCVPYPTCHSLYCSLAQFAVSYCSVLTQMQYWGQRMYYRFISTKLHMMEVDSEACSSESASFALGQSMGLFPCLASNFRLLTENLDLTAFGSEMMRLKRATLQMIS